MSRSVGVLRPIESRNGPRPQCRHKRLTTVEFMTAPLLVLSGPPGSGKTTVAALLADRFARTAHVLGDHFFRYIRSDWKDPSLPQAHEQNGHVIRISTRAAAGYAAAGYTTILDGIYGPWFLEDVQSAAGETNVHYIVLRADLDTSLARAAGRVRNDAGHQRDPEDLERMVRKMHADFDQLAQYEKYVVDTTRSTPEEVADTIVYRFEAGELLLP